MVSPFHIKPRKFPSVFPHPDIPQDAVPDCHTDLPFPQPVHTADREHPRGKTPEHPLLMRCRRVHAGMCRRQDRLLQLPLRPRMPCRRKSPRHLHEFHSDLIIEVDGGISASNSRLLFDAGAEALVAGSSVFGAESPEQAIIDMLNS